MKRKKRVLSTSVEESVSPDRVESKAVSPTKKAKRSRKARRDDKASKNEEATLEHLAVPPARDKEMKKRGVASVRQSVLPDRVESKPRAVTQSRRKAVRRKRDETENVSIREDLSSAFDQETDANSESEEEEGPESQRAASESEEEASESEEEGDTVTAETVFGFPSCPDKSNREIVTENYGFVRWARKQPEPYGNLYHFLEWLDTPEGEEIDWIGQGNQTFGYGKHAGETFKEVADSDPDYHERYMYMLERNRGEPDVTLKRYISFFEKYKSKRREVSNNSGNNKITFGQHKGKTFRWVANNDPSYHLRYLDMNPFEATRRLRKYLEYFNRHGDECAAHAHLHEEIAYHAGPYLPF